MALAAKRPVVLVVEDELVLRINAAEMIAEVGFQVVEAGNADEAIAVLEARPDIHIIFTDIQMPGSMDGLRLARLVRGRWPRLGSSRPQDACRVRHRPAGRRSVYRQALHCDRNLSDASRSIRLGMTIFGVTICAPTDLKEDQWPSLKTNKSSKLQSRHAVRSAGLPFATYWSGAYASWWWRSW
jgi:CheY-like chemotaxis protein